MKIELSRIRIKDGMSSRVGEWFDTLNSRKSECVETLEREKVYAEAIFREKIGEEEFIFWFIIQDENGETLESSPFPIDEIHQAFATECIDRTHPRLDIDASVVLLAPKITEAIEK